MLTQEDFESYSTLAGISEWKVENPSNNNTFDLETGFGLTGTKCAKLINFGQPAGSVDELISAPVDLLSISRYSKDPRHSHTLNDEIMAYHKFLKILHDITEPYQTQILETNGNHSGNGVEGRWWRWISSSDDIKQLICIPSIASNYFLFCPYICIILLSHYTKRCVWISLDDD